MRNTKHGWALLLGGLMGALPMAAQADRDTLIEGARLCTQRFPVEEARNNIPTHLLAAISTTESGRWHEGLGMSVPWPWTINVEGKGYYFKSKAEAIAQTRNFLAQGRQSIDVGCMQVNLKHHPKAFADLNDAFEPSANVAYAAKFLHDNYADLGDWIKATAAYHSRTPVYGNQYLTQIEKSWNRIVAKVSSARASTGGGSTRPETGGFSSGTSVADAPRSRPIASTHNVKVIQVNDAARAPRNEVLVIRAAPAAPSVKVADAGPVTAAPASVIVQDAGDSIRRVSLDKPLAAPQAVTQDTPSKFVFAN